MQSSKKIPTIEVTNKRKCDILVMIKIEQSVLTVDSVNRHLEKQVEASHDSSAGLETTGSSRDGLAASLSLQCQNDTKTSENLKVEEKSMTEKATKHTFVALSAYWGSDLCDDAPPSWSYNMDPNCCYWVTIGLDNGNLMPVEGTGDMVRCVELLIYNEKVEASKGREFIVDSILASKGRCLTYDEQKLFLGSYLRPQEDEEPSASGRWERSQVTIPNHRGTGAVSRYFPVWFLRPCDTKVSNVMIQNLGTVILCCVFKIVRKDSTTAYVGPRIVRRGTVFQLKEYLLSRGDNVFMTAVAVKDVVSEGGQTKETSPITNEAGDEVLAVRNNYDIRMGCRWTFHGYDTREPEWIKREAYEELKKLAKENHALYRSSKDS